MPIYVHIDHDCQTAVERLSLGARLNELREAIQQSESIDRFRKHPRDAHFLRKMLNRPYFLFARLERRDDMRVLIIFALVHANEPESKNPAKVYDEVIRGGVIDEAFRAARDAAKVNGATARDALSAVEERWLRRESIGMDEHDSNLTIMESRRWVDAMRPGPGNAWEDYRATLHNLVFRATADAEGGVLGPGVHFRYDDNSKVGVAFTTFVVGAKQPVLFLLAPLRDDSPGERSAVKTGFSDLVCQDETAEGFEEMVHRHACRAYPYLAVADTTAWLSIQKDDKANMALTPVEKKVLDSVRNPANPFEVFPVFLNGRAGSGKSTMLQYLMADYAKASSCLQQNGERVLRPIYLAWSESLRNAAVEHVRALLRCNAAHLIAGEIEEGEGFEACFHVFRDYLQRLLPPALRERFHVEPSGATQCDGGHVTYGRFVQLWEDAFHTRPAAFHARFRPGVAWHTIRTYIKGLQHYYGRPLEADEYQDVGRRQQTVSVDLFKDIHENIWSAWYKELCANGYWDDQDLAAAALEHGNFPGDVGAVVCDEAQDFTPLEFQVIFRLPVFSRRSVPDYLTGCVPFIFAGDELQTVNPTGFRWDSFSATFRECFENAFTNATLDPDRSYHILPVNYRSSEHIVKFSNLILALRVGLFNMSYCTPQKPWWIEGDSTPPTICDVDQVRSLMSMQDVAFIVDCEENEEGEFARNDEFLKEHVEFDEDGNPGKLFSPMRAKGLEWPAVVLYRFGKRAPAGFDSILNETEEYDPNVHLPCEYFFNRLYVSASRAKSRLYIVDTKNAREGFWRFAYDPDYTREIRARTQRKQPEWEESLFAWVEHGRSRGAEQDAEAGKRLADEYSKRGQEESDAYLLRQARLLYKNRGLHREEMTCYAKALELEGRYADAARVYADELQDPSSALDRYWDAKDFRGIVRLSSLHHSLKKRASHFWAKPADATSSYQFLTHLAKHLKNQPNWTVEQCSDPAWQEIVYRLSSRLVSAAKPEQLPKSHWREACLFLERLHDAGFAVNQEELAELFARAGDHQRAVALWEAANAATGPAYWAAKAEVTPFPENLEWLSKAGQYERIAGFLESEGAAASRSGAGQALAPAHMEAILEAVHHTGQFEGAARLILDKPSPENAARLLGALCSADRHDDGLLGRTLSAYVEALAEKGDWSAVCELGYHTKFGGKALGKAALDWDGVWRQTLAVLIKAMARSRSLEEFGKQSPRVSDFLKDNLQPKGEDWSAATLRNVSMVEIGAAMERAGKIIDTLSFYEWLMRDSGDPALRRFAELRLVKCRERRYKSLSPGDKRAKAAREHGTALQTAIRKQLVQSGEQIAEYPDPSAPVRQERAGHALPGTFELADGVLEITLGAGNEVRLLNRDKLAFAVIDLVGRTAKGGGLRAKRRGYLWQSKSWGLEVEMQLVEKDTYLLLRTESNEKRFLVG